MHTKLAYEKLFSPIFLFCRSQITLHEYIYKQNWLVRSHLHFSCFWDCYLSSHFSSSFLINIIKIPTRIYTYKVSLFEIVLLMFFCFPDCNLGPHYYILPYLSYFHDYNQSSHDYVYTVYWEPSYSSFLLPTT